MDEKKGEMSDAESLQFWIDLANHRGNQVLSLLGKLEYAQSRWHYYQDQRDILRNERDALREALERIRAGVPGHLACGIAVAALDSFTPREPQPPAPQPAAEEPRVDIAHVRELLYFTDSDDAQVEQAHEIFRLASAMCDELENIRAALNAQPAAGGAGEVLTDAQIEEIAIEHAGEYHSLAMMLIREALLRVRLRGERDGD